MGSQDDGEIPVLSVGDLIAQNAPFMTVIAASIGVTLFTVTSSQLYRPFDVGSLLTNDESIEDIISS